VSDLVRTRALNVLDGLAARGLDAGVMSDEELLRLRGVGARSLPVIRELVQARRARRIRVLALEEIERRLERMSTMELVLVAAGLAPLDGLGKQEVRCDDG
jgi:predicted DNA-binding helix-hairpin-helix protein